MLLAAGYAIVAMDVRGTGASFGQWRYPWHEAERHDSLCVVDWIVRQPWSDGNVCLYGISYDSNAALFTLAAEGARRSNMPSPIKAVAALYPFFDLYRDVAAPGRSSSSAVVCHLVSCPSAIC